MNDDALPKDYNPFPKLIICGNTLINVKIPFEVEGQIPLLIGNNETPKIWLSVPEPPPGKKWHQIVRTNRALHKDARVIGVDTAEISVWVINKKVLSLTKREDGVPEVTELDLRPLGLNIFGDTTQLMIGTNKLINNTFKNVRVMIGVGK